MSAEFDLIRKHFSRPAHSAILGVGDDAALLQPSEGQCLAVSSDTLVAGVHFSEDVDPAQLGWKALAVNLSDLAAMGAHPRWVLLALTLPAADNDWLMQFSAGMYQCADQYGIDLVGGDTTHGNLGMTLTIIGEVPMQQALRRSGAQAGDIIWVSGELGDAALALAGQQHKIQVDEAVLQALQLRLNVPEPRIELGLALRGVAHSAIDLSDGLLADIGHVLVASGVAATIETTSIPVSAAASHLCEEADFWSYVLAGGDDYELCFTAPESATQVIVELGNRLRLPLTAIGKIEAGSGLTVLNGIGQAMTLNTSGYDHFEVIQPAPSPADHANDD